MPKQPFDDQLVDRTVIENLLFSVVPERVADLRKLWDLYSPEFRLGSDEEGLVLEAGKGRVRFTLQRWRSAFIYGSRIEKLGRAST